MAKRFLDTDLWDKEWFMSLSCKHKCLVKMVRDKCDISGVWSPNWIIASAYIGESITEKELLEIDNGRQFKKIPGGKILCIGFVEFQYGKLSEKSPVHRKILNLLSSHLIPYQYPINRVKEEEEEEEEEMEEEKDKEKGPKNLKPKPEPEEIVLPFTSEKFKDFWNRWKKYRKEIGKPYKSPQSEKLALEKLSEFDEQFAIGLIESSISNSYQGLIFNDTKAKYQNGKTTSKSLATTVPVNTGQGMGKF